MTATGETTTRTGAAALARAGGLGPAARRWVTLLLLAVGVQVWLIVGNGQWGLKLGLKLVLAAWAVLAIPAVSRFVWRVSEPVRRPSGGVRVLIAVGLGVGAMAYLYASRPPSHRPPSMSIHDEFMFRTQTQQLAHFHLWMPKHPVGEFFETFYVFADPVYAAQSFPGAAMFFVPTVWLGLPYWWGPLLASGLVVALLYAVATELTDGAFGILAALMFVALGRMREAAVQINGFTFAMACGLAMALAYLHWRRAEGTRRRAGWLVLLGAAAGWGAITRPAEAACCALPIGLMMVRDLWGRPRGEWAWTAAAVVLAALPFLLVQVAINVGVTGRPFYTPHELYVDRYQPGFGYVFAPLDETRRPQSSLPQFVEYQRKQVEHLREYVPGRLWELWTGIRLTSMRFTFVPHPLLLVFLPLLVLAALRDRRVWVVVVAPLFLIELNYALRRPYYPHYSMSLIPAALLAITIAMHELPQTFSKWKAYAYAGTLATGLVLCVLSLPQLNPLVWDPGQPHPLIEQTNRAVAQVSDRPSVVLFTYRPGVDIMQEPVYNAEVAWPDEARVIRAHDLGDERNARLYAYYARTQPDRRVYRYDLADGTMAYLGTAGDLAARRGGGGGESDPTPSAVDGRRGL